MRAAAAAAAAAAVALLSVWCCCALAAEVWTPPAAPLPLTLTNTDELLVVSAGGLQVELGTAAFSLTVVDKRTSGELLRSSADWAFAAGYGVWEGDVLEIYEGYLTRVGAVVYRPRMTKMVGHDEVEPHRVDLEYSSDLFGKHLNVSLGFFADGQFAIDVNVIGADERDNRLFLGFEADADEAFFGFGERFEGVNQRGHEVGCWSEDGSWDLGKYFENATSKFRVPAGETGTYGPYPLFFSSRGYAMLVDTTYRTSFDMCKSSPTAFSVVTEASHTRLVFYAGAPLETLPMVTANTGRMLVPPPWMFGPWNQLGGEVNRSLTDSALYFLANDVPVSSCVNTVHFFPNASDYGEQATLRAQNAELASLGLHTTAYFNAMIDTGCVDYDKVKSSGYLLDKDDAARQPYVYKYLGAGEFEVSQLDFTNPATRTWYHSRMAESVQDGFSGFMYDYGEYTPFDSINFAGVTGAEGHNWFILQYQETAHEFFCSLPPSAMPKFPYDVTGRDLGRSSPAWRASDVCATYAPDYVYYVRSSYLGSQKYIWASWTGDPSSDWSEASGLPAQLSAMLSISLSGVPVTGSDIGGFEWYLQPPPSEDLWCRWAQLGAFSAFMHDQTGGKGTGRKSHVFDTPAGAACWRKYAKLRTALFPYLYTLMHEAHASGVPLMRHHAIEFPDDARAWSQEYQYSLGALVLVAPIVAPEQTTQSVYLPAYSASCLRARLGATHSASGASLTRVRERLAPLLEQQRLSRAARASKHAPPPSPPSYEQQRHQRSAPFAWSAARSAHDRVVPSGAAIEFDSLKQRLRGRRAQPRCALGPNGDASAGEWIDVSSSLQYDGATDGRFRLGPTRRYAGGTTVTVSAPSDVTPFFVRAGSILPLLDPSVFTLNDATNSSVVTWRARAYLLHAWVLPDASGAAVSQTLWDGARLTLDATTFAAADDDGDDDDGDDAAAARVSHAHLPIAIDGALRTAPRASAASAAATTTQFSFGVSDPHARVVIAQLSLQCDASAVAVVEAASQTALSHAAGWQVVAAWQDTPQTPSSFFYDADASVLWVRLEPSVRAVTVRGCAVRAA